MAPLALLLALAAVFAVVTATTGSGDGDGDNGEAAGDRTAEQQQQQRPNQRQRRRLQRGNYTVKLNDTLELISQKTGVPVERLQELNPELDPQNLVVGQRIKLRE